VMGLISGRDVACRVSGRRCSAPKGASDFEEFMVSLKRYPDTNPESVGSLRRANSVSTVNWFDETGEVF
jgi:hypothetical protein